MRNKEQLQQHNADLVTALDNINGLPMAENVKHGRYVWEKYRCTPPVISRNMTMTIKQTYTEIVISNPNFALPETDYMFFDGFGNSEGFTSPRFYKEGDKLKFETRSGSKVDVSSYSKGDCKITLGSNGNTSDNGTYSMVCREKIMENAKKEFIEHLVSDNPDKYPDNGDMGGYYYEKVKKPNIQYGEVTLTSTTNEVTIEHGLDMRPTKVYLIAASFGSRRNTYAILNGLNFAYGSLSGNRYYWLESASVIKAEKTVKFRSNGDPLYGGEFASGAYTWIAIA